jgi:hypothetical protein
VGKVGKILIFPLLKRSGDPKLDGSDSGLPVASEWTWRGVQDSGGAGKETPVSEDTSAAAAVSGGGGQRV